MYLPLSKMENMPTMYEYADKYVAEGPSFQLLKFIPIEFQYTFEFLITRRDVVCQTYRGDISHCSISIILIWNIWWLNQVKLFSLSLHLVIGHQNISYIYEQGLADLSIAKKQSWKLSRKR